MRRERNRGVMQLKRCVDDLKNRFILLMFPAGERAITRMGVWRECFDNEVENTVVADFSIWKMSTQRQVEYIASLMERDKKNFIVFIPGTNIPNCIPKGLVTELKCMKNPPDGIVLQIIDSVERMAKIKRMNTNEFNKYFDIFDIVYHYDLYEASKYGFVYAPLPLKKFDIEIGQREKTKVFFIGRTKGRLELIQKIAQKLEQNGIEYEFLILKSENSNLSDVGNIHFIEYLKYDMVVKHIEEATCLLSLVSENAHMMSASFTESVLYNKKLLTNCKFLSDMPCYDERYMRNFEDVSDIDIEWLCSKEEVDYHYEDQFSAKYFLKMIENDYEKGYLRKCALLNQEVLKNGETVVKFAYHFSKKGWIHDVENFQPVLLDKQLEAVSVKCPYEDCKIVYSIKQRGMEWQSMDSSRGESCGIIGKSLPITAIRLEAECEKNKYEVSYRVYISDIGWTPMRANGEICGFVNDEMRNVIMGIQIFVMNNEMCHNSKNLTGRANIENMFGGGQTVGSRYRNKQYQRISNVASGFERLVAA